MIRRPEIRISATDGSDEVSTINEAGVGTSFAHGDSGNFYYRFSDIVAVYAGIGFIGSDIDFDDVKSTLEVNGSEVDSITSSFSQSFAVINVPVGVSFSF
jgi:hypothetical protein